MLSPFGPRQIDLGNPVADHPLNYGRVLWLYGLSNTSGGRTWFDLCGGRTNGTLTNGPTWVPTGRGDRAVLFDGVNDWVDGGAAAAVGTGALSAAAWVSSSSWLADGTIVGRFDPTGNQRSWLLSIPSGDATGLQTLVNGTGAGAGNVQTGATGLLVANVPVRAVTVYVPSTSLTLYANGVQVAQTTASIPASLFASTAKLTVGARQTAGSPFRGPISDVSVWSRALSADEVWLDYVWSRGGYPAGGPLRRRTPVVYSFGPVPVGAGGWGPLVGGYRNQRVVRG